MVVGAAFLAGAPPPLPGALIAPAPGIVLPAAVQAPGPSAKLAGSPPRWAPSLAVLHRWGQRSAAPRRSALHPSPRRRPLRPQEGLRRHSAQLHPHRHLVI